MTMIPGASAEPGSRNSSPEAKIATRGRRRTSSAPRSAAAARPSRAGVSLSPAASSSCSPARNRSRRGGRSAPGRALRRCGSVAVALDDLLDHDPVRAFRHDAAGRDPDRGPRRRPGRRTAARGRFADHASGRAGDRVLLADRIAVHRRDRSGGKSLIATTGGERAPAAIGERQRLGSSGATSASSARAPRRARAVRAASRRTRRRSSRPAGSRRSSCPVDRLEHVEQGEAGDRDRGQRLHLDPGPARSSAPRR